MSRRVGIYKDDRLLCICAGVFGDIVDFRIGLYRISDFACCGNRQPFVIKGVGRRS